MKILVIGYGNPGRGDDGLGPALIERLEADKLGSEDGLMGVTTDSDYQLNIEYAVDLARHDLVILIDASVSGQEPFEFNEVDPSHEVACTTHSVSPESLVGLTSDMTKTPPNVYLMAIRGYEFDFIEKLSEAAIENLDAAYEFIRLYLRDKKNM